MSLLQRIRGIAKAAFIGAISWMPFAALSGATIVAGVLLRFGAAAGPPPVRYLLEATIATAAAFGAVAGGLWAVQVALFERAFPSSPRRQILRSALYGVIAGLIAPVLVPHASIYAVLGPELLLAACALNGGAVGTILMATGHSSRRFGIFARSDRSAMRSLSAETSVGLDLGNMTTGDGAHRDAERVAAADGSD